MLRKTRAVLSNHNFYMRKITQKRHHKNSPHYYYHHQYKISTYHHYTIIYLPDIQSTEKILHIHHFHSTTTLYYHYILSTTPNLPYKNLPTNPTILKNKINVKIVSKQKKFFCKNFCKPTNHTDVSRPTTLK